MRCFKQVHIECQTGSAYITFADETIYRYPDGEGALRGVFFATQYGTRFNVQHVRRARNSPFPYEKVESVPGTALLIYNFPPYAAESPTQACPLYRLVGVSWSGFPGAGYNNGERAYVIGGDYSVQAFVDVIAVNETGGWSGVTFDPNGVYAHTPSNPVTFTGGTTGAVVNATWAAIP